MISGRIWSGCRDRLFETTTIMLFWVAGTASEYKIHIRRSAMTFSTLFSGHGKAMISQIFETLASPGHDSNRTKPRGFSEAIARLLSSIGGYDSAVEYLNSLSLWRYMWLKNACNGQQKPGSGELTAQESLQ